TAGPHQVVAGEFIPVDRGRGPSRQGRQRKFRTGIGGRGANDIFESCHDEVFRTARTRKGQPRSSIGQGLVERLKGHLVRCIAHLIAILSRRRSVPARAAAATAATATSRAPEIESDQADPESQESSERLRGFDFRHNFLLTVWLMMVKLKMLQEL